MKRVIWIAVGVALTLGFMGAAGLFVVVAGTFESQASTPHSAFAAWATHTTMIDSVKRQAAKVQPPPAFTPAETIAGMRIYIDKCMTCHGGPGVSRDGWVEGMNPAPPYLLDAPRHWSNGQLFWVVKNGVKMTGMPDWGLTKTDGQIWDVVAFLDAMPEMKPADFQKAVAASRRR